MNGSSDVDIAVVGGGLAGLTAARALERADVRYVVLEADDRVGGRILSYDREPYWLNLGAHLFGGHSSLVGGMIADYGLQIEPAHGSITAIAYGGKVIRPSRPEALPLMFPASFRSRIALARAGLRLRRQAGKLQNLVHNSAWTSLNDRDGAMLSFLDDRTLADLLGPLPTDVDALFRAFSNRAGAPPEELSAGSGVAAFALVLKKDAALGSNIIGGSSRLIDAIVREVSPHIMRQCCVTMIEPAASSVTVRFTTNGSDNELRAGAVVVATPAPTTERIVTTLPAAMRSALRRINYNTSIVAAFLTDETGPMPWDDIYALTVPERSFNMLFNQANVLRDRGRPREPGGSLMVYGNGALGRRLAGENDESILARFVADLDEIFPGARRVIREAIVHRWHRAAPYAEPGRGTVHTALSASLPPLFFAGDYLGASFSETAALTGASAAEAALALIGARMPSV